LETIWYDDGEEAMPVDTRNKSKGTVKVEIQYRVEYEQV
jgi:hypothetical protein